MMMVVYYPTEVSLVSVCQLLENYNYLLHGNNDLCKRARCWAGGNGGGGDLAYEPNLEIPQVPT